MRAHQAQGDLPTGPGSHLHIEGVDRKAQSVNYQNEAGCLSLFPNQDQLRRRS